MEEYLEYLKRYTRVLPMTMREAHKHYICREVAREYGVTEKGLKLLDDLLEIKSNKKDKIVEEKDMQIYGQR